MKFLNLFVFLFLFPSNSISVSSSSSCGKLQRIINKLPGSCGGNNYYLECKGNNPIFHIGSAIFVVKDISFENTTFRFVNPSFSATADHCHLPNQTFPWDDAVRAFSSALSSGGFAIYEFLNCTEETDDNEYLELIMIPCLNRSNNSKVYAVPYSQDYVSYMPDSCSLVGSAVAADGVVNYTARDVMQTIQNGALVNWTVASTIYRSKDWLLYAPCSLLQQCWGESGGYSNHLADWVSWEPDMVSCLYYYSGSSVTFRLVLALFVLLDIFLIVLAVRIILAPLAIWCFLIHKHRRVSSSISSIEKFLRKNEILRIRRYDFIEISIMTNHFTEKLGQGGFGSVYRGKLLSGQQVAVKILSNSVGDGDDFISEVATIGRIHHTNIVRLIGFCSEGPKRALIYAYMPNGSLDKYIFSSSTNALSIEKRIEIAIGIARGIDYLHRGCAMQILHFDIKPHNILLDHDLTPKISDFGLARLYPRNHNIVTLSMARGTIGYIAPELISRTFGAVSYKADVYSFGMLLMEMASGRRNVNNHAENSTQVYYPSWIYDQLNLPEVAHNLSNSGVVKFGEIEERLYKVALWCIQMKASNRPTMSRVIEMLQSDANSLEMPPRPFMAYSSQEFSVRSSEIESYSIELSSISEEICVL